MIFYKIFFVSERIKNIAEIANDIARNNPNENTALLKSCFTAIQPINGPMTEKSNLINKLLIDNTVARTSDVHLVLTCSLSMGVANPRMA